MGTKTIQKKETKKKKAESPTIDGVKQPIKKEKKKYN